MEAPKEEPGAEERFARGVANALKTPPKPHKAKENAPAPKRGRKPLLDQ